MRRRWVRPVVILALIATGIIAARALGVGEAIRLENVARLKRGIESYGVLAPAVYIAGYIGNERASINSVSSGASTSFTMSSPTKRCAVSSMTLLLV